MKKLKLVFKIVGIVFVILLIVLAAFVFTFDPNNYKDTITAQVEKKTGRDFEIAGDIRLSVFPWFGITVDDVELANAEGFSDEPFARMSQLDVKIMLLPLLRKELQVDKVRLHGLFASLEVDKDGNNNLPVLAGPEEPTPEEPAPQRPVPAVETEKQPPALAALAINGVELVDATVIWTDLQNDLRSKISGFNLTTGAIRFNEPVDVELNTRAKHNDPELDALINMTTRLTFNEAFTNVLLDALQLKVSAEAPEFFKEQLELLLKSNINIDLDEEVAALNNTTLSVLKATLHANVSVSDLLTDPVVSGNMQTDDINLRELSNGLGIELPPMAAENSLTRIAYASTFKANTRFIEIDAIKLSLDKSDITGWIHVPDTAEPMVRYKLHVSPIDVDAYMAPATETAADESKPAVPAGDTAAADASADPAQADAPIELPVDLLRELDMQGELTMDSVTVNEIPLTDILIKTQARAGVLQIDPLQLKTLEGDASGSIMMSVKGKVPAYSVGLKASQIRPGPLVNPLLVGVFGEQEVTIDGAANVLADIDAQGSRVSQLQKSARGKLTFDMAKTVLQGVDFEYFVRNVVADYLATKGLPVPEEWRGSFDPQTKTAFNRAHASAVIANGDVTNPDLILDSSRVKVKGNGVINIIRNDMDYNAVVDIEPTRKKTTAEKLLDQPVGVRIHGPLEQLAYDIDTDKLKKTLTKLLEDEARARVKKEIEEEKEKLRQKAEQEQEELKRKLEQEQEELKQKLEDKLKDKLKDLF